MFVKENPDKKKKKKKKFVVQTFIACFDVSKEVCARICILIIYIPAGSNTCYNLP